MIEQLLNSMQRVDIKINYTPKTFEQRVDAARKEIDNECCK